MIKVLILGHKGMLGHMIHKVFRKNAVHFSSNPSRLALLISYAYQLFWVAIYAKKNNYTAVLANTEVFQNSLIIFSHL